MDKAAEVEATEDRVHSFQPRYTPIQRMSKTVTPPISHLIRSR